MKNLFAIAALLITTSTAHAGNTIALDINGYKIRIEAPRNCDSLSCIQISASSLSGSAPDQTAAPTSAPVALGQAVAPAQPTPAAETAAAATSLASTSAAPADGEFAPAPPVPVAGTAAPAESLPVSAATAAATATPLGIWATEENKGNIRIEPCGQNICGYAVNSGEKILINMKAAESKWTGRIHDPDSGRNYDSTIAMKGPNSLRVQGCALGGLFCGGQTWKRVS